MKRRVSRYKNERLVHAIGKIDDGLIYNAVNDIKRWERGVWFKWGAIAICLYAVIVTVFIFFGPATIVYTLFRRGT